MRSCSQDFAFMKNKKENVYPLYSSVCDQIRLQMVLEHMCLQDFFSTELPYCLGNKSDIITFLKFALG